MFWEDHKWGVIGWSGAVVATVITIVLAGFLIWQDYIIGRDVEAVQHRAQVAANSSDMLSYLKDYESALRSHGMASGHAALIFKTPANDLALLHQSVVRAIERLEKIDRLDPASTTYQVGLDDIRGTVRELEAPTGSVVWVRYGWWQGLVMLAAWAVAAILGGVCLHKSSW